MHNKRKLRKSFAVLCLVFFISCSTTPDANDRGIVIPFTIENGFIVLEATINRRTGRFLWDNGANFSIFPGARRRTGQHERWYHYTVIQGERTLVPFYLLESVRFGNNDVRAQSLIIRQINDFGGRVARLHGLDGMLGNCIFNGFWLELSFSRNEIVLHREKPMRFTNASHAPLRTMHELGRVSDRRLYLPVDINGREFNLLIDTGAWFSFAFPGDIVNHKAPDDVRQITSRMNPWSYYLVRTDSVTILDRTYHNKFIMTNSHVTTRWEDITTIRDFTDIGVIGTTFMSYFDFLIDYRNLWYGINEGMFFKPITPPEERNYGFFSFLTDAPEFGLLQLRMGLRGLDVVSVLTDSPAYITFGLRPGSVITRINGEPFRSFSRYELIDPLFFDRAIDLSILNPEGAEELILVAESMAR